MKRVLSFCFIIALFFFCCNSKDTAVQYNDTIIKPQLEVVTKLDSLYTNSDPKLDKITQHRRELVSIVQKAISDIKKLEDYKGDISFKKSALKYFSHLNYLYYTTPNIDSLIFYFNSPLLMEKMDKKDFNFMETELKKYIELENDLLEEQKRFAEKFNMRLEY